MVWHECMGRDRPDEKISDGQSEYFLMNSIISKVLPESESRETAAALLLQFGDIRSVLRASSSEIMRKTRTSSKVAEELSRTHALIKALARADIRERPLLDDCQAVLKYCRAFLAGRRREQFHSLYLDRSFHLLAHECLQIGTVDHVAVYPRELMALALQHSASSIILVHNHPSGNATPSKADRSMTETLQRISSFFGIAILDHIIIGAAGDFSFREHNMLGNDPHPRFFDDQSRKTGSLKP